MKARNQVARASTATIFSSTVTTASVICESQPRDLVEAVLTANQQNIVEWISQTQDNLWEDLSATFGEIDDT
jgi:hypothetical protein